MKLIGLILLLFFLFSLFIIIGVGSFLRSFFKQSKRGYSENEGDINQHSNNQKVFSKNEGEYVDFEELEDKEEKKDND